MDDDPTDAPKTIGNLILFPGGKDKPEEDELLLAHLNELLVQAKQGKIRWAVLVTSQIGSTEPSFGIKETGHGSSNFEKLGVLDTTMAIIRHRLKVE